MAEGAFNLLGRIIVLLEMTDGEFDERAESGDVGGKCGPNLEFGPRGLDQFGDAFILIRMVGRLRGAARCATSELRSD